MPRINYQELSQKLKTPKLHPSTLSKARALANSDKIDQVSETVFYVQGSKDKAYSVEQTDKGLTCTCDGYRFKGLASGMYACKHTEAIKIKFNL